jgi:O-methyltransferase involved in polyketide biosynthesis
MIGGVVGSLSGVMTDGEPSQTAFTAAAARAAHLIVDDEPVIFADTLAAAMLGERAEELIGYHLRHGTHPVLAMARAQVVCRSRYTEDSLARAIDRGIRQYVILGAGLESFAHRGGAAPGLESSAHRGGAGAGLESFAHRGDGEGADCGGGGVRVFEVDHPATQEWKRRVLAVPDGLVFVPVDFGVDSLAESLRLAGFDFAAPAFVSWLGVTVYLGTEAIDQTLSVVGGFAPGSEIVVDYMLPAGLRDAAGADYADQVGRVSAERGEPWLSFFAPEEMAARLGRHGLPQIRDVRQRDMVPDALWDRTDSLRPAELSRLAHGRVADLARGRGGARGEARRRG